MTAFHHCIRVRYNECDQQNAVFNANYLVYFDVAITELWREALGSYNAMAKHGVDLVVAEANVRYLAPARFDNELDIRTTVTKLGTTSIITLFEVFKDDTQTTEGRLRHVVVDLETGAKTSIPDEIRTALEGYGPDSQ